MVFVQNLLYLHGKRRGSCDASSNWKLDARRVNENLSIHAPRTINYYFIWRGTSGIGYIPKRRSHHRRVIRYFQSRTTRWGNGRVEGKGRGERGKGIDAILRECGKSNRVHEVYGPCIVRLLPIKFEKWYSRDSSLAGMIIKKERGKSRGREKRESGELIRSALAWCACFTVI